MRRDARIARDGAPLECVGGVGEEGLVAGRGAFFSERERGGGYAARALLVDGDADALRCALRPCGEAPWAARAACGGESVATCSLAGVLGPAGWGHGSVASLPLGFGEACAPTARSLFAERSAAVVTDRTIEAVRRMAERVDRLGGFVPVFSVGGGVGAGVGAALCDALRCDYERTTIVAQVLHPDLGNTWYLPASGGGRADSSWTTRAAAGALPCASVAHDAALTAAAARHGNLVEAFNATLAMAGVLEACDAVLNASNAAVRHIAVDRRGGASMMHLNEVVASHLASVTCVAPRARARARARLTQTHAPSGGPCARRTPARPP